MRVNRMPAIAVVFMFLVSFGFGQSQGRTERFAVPVTVTGQNLGSCGSFDVLTDYVVMLRDIAIFDKDGHVARENLRAKSIGASVYYNSTDPELFLIGGPAEIEIDHFDYRDGIISVTGIPWKIKVPGYGSIWLETGRLVLDLNSGEVLSNTGHNQYVDKDLDAVCKFLTPIP